MEQHNKWKDLAIILLNYNSFSDTSLSIHHLIEEGISKDPLYIVDNNSLDGDALGRLCDTLSLKYIKTLKNGGYAYGNNIAIKQALDDGKKYFLLLNPDINISSNTIQALLDKLKSNKDLQMIGPRICDKHNKELIYSDGGILTPLRTWDSHIHYNEIKSDITNNKPFITDIDYINGAAIMFKKEVIDTIGLMREDFFMYYEETEWCYRLKKHPQCKIGVLTSYEAYHQMSPKGDFYQYYTIRNRIYFFRMYGLPLYGAVKKTFTRPFKNLFKNSNNESLITRWNTLLITSKAIFRGLTKKYHQR